MANVGKGKIICGTYAVPTLSPIGVERDFDSKDLQTGERTKGIGFTHRRTEDAEIYFISNQLDKERIIEASFRCAGKVPELWDAVSGETMDAKEWRIQDGRTIVPIRLGANGSLFVMFKKATSATKQSTDKNWVETKSLMQLTEKWTVHFDTSQGGPIGSIEMNVLKDWTSFDDQRIKYYSGTANYTQNFTWNGAVDKTKKIWISLGKVDNLATVYVNDIDCGTAWTSPYKLDISKALKKGSNTIRINVTNTWANRIQGDQLLPEDKRVTWTTAPYKLKDQPLNAAGLLGPVTIEAPSNPALPSGRSPKGERSDARRTHDWR
jgi:hypothetical protein